MPQHVNGKNYPQIGHITAFDKGHYDQLIKFLADVDNDVNTNPQALGTSAALKLDSTLNTRLKPGSQDWSVAKDFATRAGSFGNSAHTRYTAVEQDVRTFTTALKGAEDVFENTDDLANYDASQFVDDYPDVGMPPTTGTP
ncbi:MAG: hypothetical protein ACRDP6_36890 [Actinoallomurus sp.]